MAIKCPKCHRKQMRMVFVEAKRSGRRIPEWDNGTTDMYAPLHRAMDRLACYKCRNCGHEIEYITGGEVKRSIEEAEDNRPQTAGR